MPLLIGPVTMAFLLLLSLSPGYGGSLLGLPGTCHLVSPMLGCKTCRARREIILKSKFL